MALLSVSRPWNFREGMPIRKTSRRSGLSRYRIRAIGASEVWVTHGAEEALYQWCGTQGISPARSRFSGAKKRTHMWPSVPRIYLTTERVLTQI